VAPPFLIDVDDAVDGAALVSGLGRHGLVAGLAPANDRWRVEVDVAGEHPQALQAELGVALLQWSGADERIAGITGMGKGETARLGLHMLLLAGVWFEFDRRRDQLPPDEASVDSLARQVAGAAYAALLGSLGDYHGQSRFTTWAAKFAIHEAAAAARRLEGDGHGSNASSRRCHNRGT
jgi:hypothetical protein